MNPTQALNEASPAQTDDQAIEAAQAKIAWKVRLRGVLTAVLGAGDALRRRLGKPRATQDAHEAEADSEDLYEPDSLHHEAAATPDESSEAPAPGRRLRPVLIQGGLLLAGCIGGGALAYSLFQHQLSQQLQDSQRREAALAKQIQPVANVRQALEAEKAKRIAAEAKLASATAEYAKSTAEQQKALDAAQTHPAKLVLAEGSRTDGHTPPLRSGDCTLDPKNIGALKRCIEEFNR